MSVGKLPWRVGMRVGRTIYDADDNLIGMLDTAELAERAVEAVNRNIYAPDAETLADPVGTLLGSDFIE